MGKILGPCARRQVATGGTTLNGHRDLNMEQTDRDSKWVVASKGAQTGAGTEGSKDWW